MIEVFYPYLAVLAVSLVSLIGIIAFFIKERTLDKFIIHAVSFAAGALLAASFFDLIPESVENWGSRTIPLVFVGIILFFILERFLFFYHCHRRKCPYHTFTYINLIGDGVHNFTDGAIIAASFSASIHLGLITTLAVIFHEIPQEIGDFSILIYGGIEKKRALLYNFLVALTAFLGVFFVHLLGNVSFINSILIPIGAGGFIYLATTDLLPTLHKIEDPKKSAICLVLILFGALLIFAVNYFPLI
jgi:zinc and cadmium transporter